MYGGEMHTGVPFGDLRERDHSEDLGTDCDNIKMDMKHVGRGRIDRINLDEGRYRWRGLVNAIMNLRVTQNAGGIS